jgi:uncharacterized protein (TIGR02466 family)
MSKIPFENFFSSPIFRIEKPQWLSKINKACDPLIKKSKKDSSIIFKNRDKAYKVKKGDFGWSYHTGSLINLKGLEELQHYIGESSLEVLNEMGYDLSNYKLNFTEFWAQEFSKQGGGHHDAHCHYDTHISGFYFLKCSPRTSYPVFHDPRPGKLMAQLPMKNPGEIESGTDSVHVKLKPGTFIIFPSYLTHRFAVDLGIDTFRFIHFNIQAVRNSFYEK